MKKKLHILVKERAELATEARDLVALITEADRDPDEKEQARLDEIKAELETRDAELDKRAKEAKLAEPFAARDDVHIVPAQAIDREAEARGGFLPYDEGGVADFALAVYQSMAPGGVIDDRLKAAVHQEVGSATGDSFMVPAEMSASIFELATEQSDFFAKTLQETTSKNQITKLVDDTTPYGATGIQAAWRAEGVQMTGSNLDTEANDLKLNELFAFATATDELIEDAPLLNGRLQRGASRAIAWKLDEGIFRGNGSGQPAGFLNSAALVAQAKEGSQVADTVVAANVLKMYTRMITASINSAEWVANPDIMPQLSTMTIGDQPVYLPPGGLTQSPHGILMGRPLMFSQHCNTLGDQGDLIFVDFKGYHTAKKASGVKFAVSIHLRFDFNEQAFRWVLRVGGQPILDAVVAAQFGSNTMSHFVTLAERA